MGVRTKTKQVFAKEALIELPVWRQQSYSNERYMRPSLKAFAMAIETVVHDMSAMYLLLTVYLPENDIPFLCGTNEIIVINAADLFWGETEFAGNSGGEPLPECTMGRMTARDILHR